MALSDELRERTLLRFATHQRAWDAKPELRTLYAEWYRRVAAELPPVAVGPRIELGSGPGFAREFIPDLELTDLVKAPWHDREVSAEDLPFADRSIGALVLFDVLHHIPAPRRFFEEANRVLCPGGRLVLCEPYISPVSWPVNKLFHVEPVYMRVDPLAPNATEGRDPFDANQGIPTLLFVRERAAFERAFPALAIRRIERLAGLSYPASGGFSRRRLLVGRLWTALYRLESRLPERAFALLGFRMLIVLEKLPG
jgi:SAM-dependent methyltransferase